MAARSEEVLLIVNNVRNKKTDGTLYMMGERLGWMQGSKSTFSISYLYADIKAQKISPDSKEKVQLQLVLHDGGANTFHFINPKGRTMAITDRDSVKDLLQQLIPKFRRKLSSELEEKNRMLQENPELFQLYKDLVVTGVITAEEFWASRKTQSSTKPEKSQTVGVSAAFLADIKPQTDGCNGLKYNLTADIIESIFRTYPMVKKKHAEHVPHDMTESEFWTRFFQSHYFHRDRTVMGTKDVFTDCAKSDEKDMKEEISDKPVDLFLDLTKISDSSLHEDYRGLTEDTRISNNVTNGTMIRRFNHHSTMVLKACTKDSQSAQNSGPTDNAIQSSDTQKSSDNSKVNGVNMDESRPSTSKGYWEPAAKKQKLQEKIHMDDLKDTNSKKNVNLQLHKMEGYLHGPTPVTMSRYTTSEDLLHASESVMNDVHHWSHDLSNVLLGSQAIVILSELSPGGALLKGTSHSQLNQIVPLDVQEEVKACYSALLELLRHFWTCFPVSSKSLEEKVIRMKSTLERFQMAKLMPLKERLQDYHYTINMTSHMEELLLAASRKFDMWQSRKSAIKR
ncbi:general transcription factor IIH subunit 1-like [Ostrea edulis]|uniref:general transcription factor IIH subunit 1-like n=1 Tax=Ostrea edulis TaxID=37623 RepID=UPI0024AF3A9F|nr:general transcription factor IIH subunit 1-like [Ostrea edulis]